MHLRCVCMYIFVYVFCIVVIDTRTIRYVMQCMRVLLCMYDMYARYVSLHVMYVMYVRYVCIYVSMVMYFVN